jgi:hypothetical protein
MEKKHLSVKLSPEAYNLLKSDINFVEELIVRELGSAEKK